MVATWYSKSRNICSSVDGVVSFVTSAGSRRYASKIPSDSHTPDDIREHVEGAFRHLAADAGNPPQPLDHEVAPGLERIDHLPVLRREERRLQPQPRALLVVRGDAGEVVDVEVPEHLRLGRGGKHRPADPAARPGEAFRCPADEDRALLHARDTRRCSRAASRRTGCARRPRPNRPARPARHFLAMTSAISASCSFDATPPVGLDGKLR